MYSVNRRKISCNCLCSGPLAAYRYETAFKHVYIYIIFVHNLIGAAMELPPIAIGNNIGRMRTDIQNAKLSCIRACTMSSSTPACFQTRKNGANRATNRKTVVAAPKKRLHWGPKLRSESIEEVGPSSTPILAPVFPRFHPWIGRGIGEREAAVERGRRPLIYDPHCLGIASLYASVVSPRVEDGWRKCRREMRSKPRAETEASRTA